MNELKTTPVQNALKNPLEAICVSTFWSITGPEEIQAKLRADKHMVADNVNILYHDWLP